MPADYHSTAQALALPISPVGTSSPSPSSTPGPRPPWVRDRPSTNARRLSTPYSRSASSGSLPLGARILRTSADVANTVLRVFLRLTPLQRALAVGAGLAGLVLLVVFLVYSHGIFAALEPIAKGWRDLPGGWVLVWLMTFATAFPPMIGYSTCITIAGFVFGFPGGWPIVATATVAGSGVAFLTSRTVFSKYVHALVGTDKRFVALGHVLRHDGLLVLAGIRFCPLPYSLSNGFLATIPNISPVSFALATALATPKLLVHVFIGSRLAELAERGDEMTAGDKAINYISMLLGALLGMAIGLVIYKRTMARASELAREEAAENGGMLGPDDEVDYEDLEEGVLNRSPSRQAEADAAALMDDDDISLWETDGIDDGYRDEDELADLQDNGAKKSAT
ncbi:hypothetical protein JX266_010370 [Neoarthrinium moseri]|uniref:uncharacterized protein n=1 Tax=Neoarthrinium moseri TaxID=1658444 RepID=UPI001FDE7FCF|nr:uncharacterized protein JN550_012717 [Neoarthrinium moseri]KAI1843373.1 hypothetical protein JX266_010370 [Neoarthrinium moseri]KAI1858352.1 hypothetical protein JN550_012717 [Neoarthrinium moseri]